MSEVVVVGIGADGWSGLPDPSREALRTAEVVVGGARQLGLLPAEVTAERVAWPSPLVPAVPRVLAAHAGRRLAVLASGDPTHYGIATTLARFAPLRVLPHPSSVALACARLGWAQEDTAVVSAVGRPLETLHALLAPGRRILVLSAGAETPVAVLALLDERGFADAEVTVLERLGAPDERVGPWHYAVDPLNVVAIECRTGPALPLVPGLPDDAYAHDGQLTKREVRAITLARLGPLPGELLWDVGGGAGSIAIEWMRTHPSCRAVAIERDPVRAERLAANARALGVPALRVVTGTAPAALRGLPAPDAVFVGGGVTAPALIDTCRTALRPGGRLVVNAVTVESEAVLARARADHGGDLTRIDIARAAPVGAFTGWRPAMPVTQWTVTR
ncbi:Precorrin-6Y C(5,15)-methyltransferase [decarboxylating] [Actinomadura rubteroloni]|uniref:Precorrin-6Y C(5,15)-methyltransferase [decarboxylating] n=1 Tax=Actinomadura rubteroloni TaxID=1926885 RepID=A0A2P4UNQ8_9ACTN|nr:precorrin-6y C5,15-methyltransferase (decarboxylating) subunit CbiE [Actinomadura rubteroloni]POM26686.1 Precorrin-6Y C(5,15)-methyltransferase [decarboxylating] [Actinomadura rubteroloni]